MTVRIGIDLGGTKIAGIALDKAGKTVARGRSATPRGDYGQTIEAIVNLVRQLEAQSADKGDIGIGIPGAMSQATGQVKNANSTWLIGRALNADLAAATGRRVRIENDANCFAISEAADGAATGAKTVFGAILGTGVGGGLVVGGEPITGANSIAGEWGHNPLPWPTANDRPERRCYCGRSGCIETFLSGPALEDEYALIAGNRLAAEEIAALAAAGDAAAEKLLARYEERLARALSSVINIVDPDVIVLGGGLSNIGRLYENVPAIWPAYVFSDNVVTQLLRPAHGDSSGVRGAAWLWPAAD